MPADIKGKTSIVRKVPYDVLHRSRTVKVADSETQITQGTPHNCNLPTLTIARPLPLGSFWGSGSGGQQYSETTNSDDSSDFISRLSAYLKLKNEIYKTELGNMEEALTKAEETTKHLKGMITNLGHMVDALEGTLSTATYTLTASLVCAICLETCSNPTSLRCGHSFCRDCLQSWFLTKFESRCESFQIKLTGRRYAYIYSPASAASEAERNMWNFAKLSNRINPEYNCPSCRDPLLPSLRNCFLDFKLAASLNTLNALIGYVPANTSHRKYAGVDLLAFLNSRFFRRHSERYMITSNEFEDAGMSTANNSDSDEEGTGIDLD